jgi:hypothetical protein
MERIDKLIKLPVSVNDSYKVIDADGLYILEVGVPYILTDKDIAITEALRDLINGQNVDVERMAEDDLDKLFERYESETGASVFATNFFKGWLKKNLHGSTLSQSWVSVEDRLPPQKSKHEIVSENVLVCRMNDPMAYIHYYHHGNKKWYGYGQSQCTYDVTHWMPTPPRPSIPNQINKSK